MLARIARRLADPARAFVILTTPACEDAVREAVAPFAAHASYVLDAEPGTGPLRPLVDAARLLAEREIATFAAIAGDMPDVDLAHVRALEAAIADDCEAVVAVDADGRRHPLASIYRTRAFAAAGAASLAAGERRLGRVLEDLHVCEWRAEGPALANLNTPADVAERTASG